MPIAVADWSVRTNLFTDLLLSLRFALCQSRLSVKALGEPGFSLLLPVCNMVPGVDELDCIWCSNTKHQNGACDEV